MKANQEWVTSNKYNEKSTNHSLFFIFSTLNTYFVSIFSITGSKSRTFIDRSNCSAYWATTTAGLEVYLSLFCNEIIHFMKIKSTRCWLINYFMNMTFTKHSFQIILCARVLAQVRARLVRPNFSRPLSTIWSNVYRRYESSERNDVFTDVSSHLQPHVRVDIDASAPSAVVQRKNYRRLYLRYGETLNSSVVEGDKKPNWSLLTPDCYHNVWSMTSKAF